MPGSDLATSEAKGRMERQALNFSLALTKEYESTALKTLARGTTACLQGIGGKRSKLLAQLGPKTVDDLAKWKFARWAEAICIMEPLAKAGMQNFSDMKNMMNINKALDSEWEGSSLNELLEAPISALEGVSERQGKIFKSLGIKTIQDLGTWKYYIWARGISTLAEVE